MIRYMVKKLAYFSVMASLIGASVISIDFKIFQLSLYRALIIFILFILVLKMFLTNGKISITRRYENSYSIKFMLIWLIYALFSLGWVKDYSSWFRAIYFLSLGVLCVLIYSKTFKEQKDILSSFRVMSVMIIIHNIFGWYEILTGKYLFLTNSQEYYARYKYPVSMFGNTNDFATFMLISIFILYVCLVNSKLKLGKILYIITTISSLYLLVMTTSRANILGLIIALITFVYLSVKNKQKRRSLLVILIILFSINFIIPSFYNNLFMIVNANLSFDLTADMGSDFVRINLIKNGLYFLVNTLGFGTGAGNIEYWMENYSIYPTLGIINIHNWWMEILTGYGIIIFTLYVIFYLKLFRDLYSVYRITKSKIESSISLAVLCSMTGFAIGSISSSSNINSEWLWVYWALAIAFQSNSCNINSRKILFAREGKISLYEKYNIF